MSIELFNVLEEFGELVVRKAPPVCMNERMNEYICTCCVHFLIHMHYHVPGLPEELLAIDSDRAGVCG